MVSAITYVVLLDGKDWGGMGGKETRLLSERGKNREFWAMYKYSVEYEVVQAAQTPLRKGHR